MVRKNSKAKRSKRSSRKKSKPEKVIEENDINDDSLEESEIEELIGELNQTKDEMENNNEYVASLTHSEAELLDTHSISIDHEDTDDDKTPFQRRDTPHVRATAGSSRKSKRSNAYQKRIRNVSYDSDDSELESDDSGICGFSIAAIPLALAFIAAVVLVLLVEFDIIDISQIFKLFTA